MKKSYCVIIPLKQKLQVNYNKTRQNPAILFKSSRKNTTKRSDPNMTISATARVMTIQIAISKSIAHAIPPWDSASAGVGAS